MKLLLVFLYSSIFLISVKGHAASCCGGGGYSGANLILNPNRHQQFTHTVLTSHITDTIDSHGVWKKYDIENYTLNYKFDYAEMVDRNWQWGFSLPLELKHLKNSDQIDHFGLGDISLVGGHIYYPAVFFTSITGPSAGSIYDVNSNSLSQVHGKGFWTFGLGTTIKDEIENFHWIIMTEIHQSLNREIAQQNLAYKIKPGPGGSVLTGLSYAFPNYVEWDAGVSLKLNYESPIKISGAINSDGAFQRWIDSSLAVGYLYNPKMYFSMAYSTNAWFGSPQNTNLNENLSLTLQIK